MNTARIVVLAIAVAALGPAIRPLSGLEPRPMAHDPTGIAGADAQSDIQISQTGIAGDRAKPGAGSGASSTTAVQG